MNAWESWSSFRNNRWVKLKARVTVLPPAQLWVFPVVVANIVTLSIMAPISPPFQWLALFSQGCFQTHLQGYVPLWAGLGC